MKKFLMLALCVSIGCIGSIHAKNNGQKKQCNLEKAVLNSNATEVRSFFVQGNKGRKKLTCTDADHIKKLKELKDFKGTTIPDLADYLVEHWNKEGNKEKLNQAQAVRSIITPAIGKGKLK